jgi:aminoglycoside 6-adenylyltransferase
VKPGVYGRGLKQLLPPDVWSELAYTYGSLDVAATWDSLDRAIALFRRVALNVGNTLGYVYPQQVDDDVSAFLDEIRHLDVSA